MFLNEYSVFSFTFGTGPPTFLALSFLASNGSLCPFHFSMLLFLVILPILSCPTENLIPQLYFSLLNIVFMGAFSFGVGTVYGIWCYLNSL